MALEDLRWADAVLLRLVLDPDGELAVPETPPYSWAVATAEETARILVPASYRALEGRDPQAVADTDGRFVGQDRTLGYVLVHRGAFLRCEGRVWEVVDAAARDAWQQLFTRARAALA